MLRQRRVTQYHVEQLKCSLCASVMRAASICTVISSLHSDIRAVAQQQHILQGPSGELELLLFSTMAAIISASD